MTTRSLAAWMLAALLPVAACRSSSSSPTGPSPTGPRTGTWSGTVADPVNGSGALRVVLEDFPFGEQSLLTGTWATTFADATKNSGGTVAGTVTGAAGTLGLNPGRTTTCTPPAPFPTAVGSYVVPNLTVSTNAISGAYVFLTCDRSVAGTMDLRR